MGYGDYGDMDDSSDIELVNHIPVASTSAAVGSSRGHQGVNINSHNKQDGWNMDDSNQDFGDFFAEASNGASNASAAANMRDLSPPPPPTRTAVNTNTSNCKQQPTTSRMNTDKSDVIEIDSDDEDEDDDPRPNATAYSSTAAFAKQTSQPSLRKTHSAPTAVFDNGQGKGKGKQPLFEPMYSSDEDEDDLPDLGRIAGHGNALKRSSSETIPSTSKRRFKYIDSTGASDTSRSNNNMHSIRGGLSPIPASSPPPPGIIADSSYSSRDTNRASDRLLLPSDISSSENEDKEERVPRKKKVTRAPVEQNEPEPGPSNVKPPTKKQLLEQERAAKKEAKEKEKREKAEALASEKERKNGLKVANKLEDRQAHCAEILVDITTPLLEDTFFKNKIWIGLTARFEHVHADHSQPGHGRLPKPGCFDKLILWRRRVTKDYCSERRYWVPRAPEDFTVEQEKNVLMFMTGQEVEQAVAAHKFPEDEDRSDTLLEMVANVKRTYGMDYKVIILVQNLSQKMKAKRSAENAEFQAEVRAAAGAPITNAARRKKAAAWDNRVTMEDIEQEFVRLQLVARCSIQKNETPEDAVDWIAEFTKDIAHRPYKMIERVREMYLNIDGKIESSDRGDLHKTYVNQLACINGVTEATARAIAARFPTWRCLLQAYRNAPDPRQTLAAIPILNRVDGAATSKTTGPVLSERIHIFLTSKDPNLLFTGDIKAVRGRV